MACNALGGVSLVLLMWYRYSHVSQHVCRPLAVDPGFKSPCRSICEGNKAARRALPTGILATLSGGYSSSAEF